MSPLDSRELKAQAAQYSSRNNDRTMKHYTAYQLPLQIPLITDPPTRHSQQVTAEAEVEMHWGLSWHPASQPETAGRHPDRQRVFCYSTVWL